MEKVKEFFIQWYPIILAFICMLYSIGLGVTGSLKRPNIQPTGQEPFYYSQLLLDKEEGHEWCVFYSWILSFWFICILFNLEYIL